MKPIFINAEARLRVLLNPLVLNHDKFAPVGLGELQNILHGVKAVVRRKEMRKVGAVRPKIQFVAQSAPAAHVFPDFRIRRSLIVKILGIIPVSFGKIGNHVFVAGAALVA